MRREELLEVLRVAVQEMRGAQRDYFKHRTTEYLRSAKKAEARVDEILRRLGSEDAPPPAQGTLFGGG